ncbi:MAG: ATP-binding cassette domain-containing protein [Oscillospiraceae bacterium]|nr:ATP-binding cassette domain-containing protein [Oscillospiraceae bacterium]
MPEFKNICFSYGEKQILKDFSFSVEEGISTGILGPSGLGKTTLMNIAAGLVKPKSGTAEKFSGQRYSFVFQEDRLLPWCTALENLKAVGIEESRAKEYLCKVELEEAAEKYPKELSGGMARRLAIARALAFGGDTFFFDEPLRGLDIKTSAKILELIKQEIHGKTAFIITHSPAEAFYLCDRIVFCGGEPFDIIFDKRKTDFADENELMDFIKIST